MSPEARTNDQNVTDGPAGIPRDASPLLKLCLDDWQHLFDALHGDGPKLSQEERRLVINRQVDLFGSIFLLGVLRQRDPALADEAAAWLADQWDAGDSLGEWIYQWRMELAAGQPLSLGVGEKPMTLDFDGDPR